VTRKTVAVMTVVVLLVLFSCENPASPVGIGSSDDSNDPSVPNDGSESLAPEIHLADFIGLALAPASVEVSSTIGASIGSLSTGGYELVAIDATGAYTSVFELGQAPIERFLIAPNSKAYLLFSRPINLDDPETIADSGGTLLAELDLENNSITSVVDDLSAIGWPANGVVNRPIQFDDAGNLYITGTTSSGNRVLRRIHSGGSTDLINENIRIDDFLVNGDGSVLMMGQTTSSGQTWIRKLDASGSIANIAVSSYSDIAQFMRRFPDQRVYFGRWSDESGVFRLDAGVSILEERPWISGSSINEITYDPYHNVSDIPGGDSGYWYTHVSQFFETFSGVLFGVQSNGSLIEYYPDPKNSVEITVTQITSVVSILDQLVIAGTVDTENALVLYDTGTKSETSLLDGRNIEVYDVNLIADSSTLMFIGLDFANNQRVIGQIPLSGTRTVTTVPVSGNIELSGFRTF
jgi:hypothetical protein